MKSWFLLLTVIALLSQSPYASAQETNTTVSPTRIEVQKLLRSFEGTWSVFESFQKSEFFPKAGARTGTAKITPGPGRLSLIEDYHSSGSAGNLDLLAVTWWGNAAQ